jgi:hypothetical protein
MEASKYARATLRLKALSWNVYICIDFVDTFAFWQLAITALGVMGCENDPVARTVHANSVGKKVLSVVILGESLTSVSTLGVFSQG